MEWGLCRPRPTEVTVPTAETATPLAYFPFKMIM